MVAFYVQAGLFVLIFLILAFRSSPAEASLKARSYSEEDGGLSSPVGDRAQLLHPMNVAEEADLRSSASSIDNNGNNRLKNKLRDSARLARQSLTESSNGGKLRE